MPVHWNHRADSLIYLFVFGVIAITAAAFRTLDKQRFLNRLLIATAALLCLTVALDWLLLSNTLLHLWRQGRLATMGIELGLLLFAGCCLYTARLLFMPQHKRMAINNNTSESTAK
jgi:heme A synthase